jgi:tRNA threonylcarbamoyladenosine biosynthesis protein TsaB
MSRTLLALDTATEACSVALYHRDEIFEHYELTPQQHGQHILSMVDKLLKRHDVALSALDGIAFGHGPGSFTGLRIAASVTQGLALAHDLPVLGISDCQALAQWAWRQGQHQRVLAIIDARMHEVYWGLYQQQNGIMQAEQADQVSATVTGSNLPDVAVGNGCGLVELELAQTYPDVLPHAYDIALIASSIAESQYVPASQAQPVYIRNRVTHQSRS